ETFDGHKVLENALTIIKTQAYKKHIELSLKVTGELPPVVADEAKFKQILYNLLSNAIKFTPDGGRVVVTARVQSKFSSETQAVSPGDYLRIEVTDTGIGIQPQDQDRIFI